MQYKKTINEDANRDILFLVVLVRIAIGLCFGVSVDFWFEDGANADMQHITGLRVSSKISDTTQNAETDLQLFKSMDRPQRLSRNYSFNDNAFSEQQLTIMVIGSESLLSVRCPSGATLLELIQNTLVPFSQAPCLFSVKEQ